jgi:coenzyme PQQ precursor peptide PqqA
MEWQTPQFTEIRMDAEINAYQEDSQDDFVA